MAASSESPDGTPDGTPDEPSAPSDAPEELPAPSVRGFLSTCSGAVASGMYGLALTPPKTWHANSPKTLASTSPMNSPISTTDPHRAVATTFPAAQRVTSAYEARVRV